MRIVLKYSGYRRAGGRRSGLRALLKGTVASKMQFWNWKQKLGARSKNKILEQNPEAKFWSRIREQ
jgi:hypothetical protein